MPSPNPPAPTDIVVVPLPSGGDDTAAIQAALDIAFGPISNPHGTANNYLNKQVRFQPGRYRTSAPLKVKYLHGGRITGAGRFATQIENTTVDSNVFETNGCGYSHFEGMLLKSNGTGAAFSLDWDGTPGGAALQSNTFVDMFFYGGNFGVRIGASGFMGSENLFLNCFWLLCATAGMIVENPNALQQTVIGGNVQGCGVGFWAAAGSIPVITGVGFQQQTDCDWRVDYSANNTQVISGCRSESTNFVRIAAGVPTHISGCTHTSGTNTDGDFVWVMAAAVITACRTTRGRIHARYAAHLKVSECYFDRSDWLDTYQLWYIPNNNVEANIEIENVWHGAGFIPRQRLTAAGTFNYVVAPA